MKKITKFNKVWACILALTLFVGVLGPMQTVQAEVNYVDSGKITLHGNSSGQLSQPDYLWFTTTDTSLSVSASTQITAETGTVTRTRAGETTDVTSSVALFCDTTAGLFHFILPGNAGMSAQDGDEFTLQGRFKVDNTRGIDFETITFRYTGDGTSDDADDYWKIVPTYANSGTYSLMSNSNSGAANAQYIYFYPANGASLNNQNYQTMVADTGRMKFRSASTGVETIIPAGYYGLYIYGSDLPGLFNIFLTDNYKAQTGDTVTLEGKFTYNDGLAGVNFQKVVFEYVEVGTTRNWRIWPSSYIASGDITLHANSSRTDYCGGNNLWFETTDATFPSTTLFATTGSVIMNRQGEETDISETYALARSEGNGPYYLTFGNNVLQDGDMVTISGKFSSADGQSGIDFETVTFKYTGDGTAEDTDDYWEIVKDIDYIDSGALSLHSNSSSPRDTSGTYDGNVVFWFNTVDVTFPQYSSKLVTKGGQITVKKAATGEVVDIYDNGAVIESWSEGLYRLGLLDANKVSNGDMLTIQGKFAKTDGSAGINFQPVTFQYIEESGKGYWIAEGMTFTSGQYVKTETPYTSEILAFEADIRLSANATNKGGVVLGTDDGSSDAYTFGVDANGAPYLSLKDGSNEVVEYIFTGVNVCTNEWVNLVIVRDKTNSKVSCYVDDVSKGELSITNNAEILPTADAVVGGNDSKDNAQFFKGRIRTVKLYADVNKTSLIASYDMSYIGANAKSVSDNSGNAYNLSYSLRWVDKAPTIGDYAYSFAVVGDTQTLNDSYKTEMAKVYKYITDNATSKNTKFVFGLGDITEWNGGHGLDEWQRAKDYITTLDTAGIPYSLCRGNHEGIVDGGGSTLMNEYFPYANYKDKLSVYYDGKIENSCQFLTVGNVDYMIFALDYNPSEDVVDWAASIIETHPNHNVIITTHSYLSIHKTLTSEGTLIWEKLANKYENVVLVLSGHVGRTYDIIWNQVTGENGNTVTQMMVNPQWADEATAGGTGMVAMLYFSADGKNVQVEYYSTIRNQWLADTNQFSFELNVVEHVDAVTVKSYTNVLTNYRSTEVYTYPEIDGYVFAGWFTNAACTKEYALAKDAIVDDATTYYAKFVDKNAMTLKRQITENTTLSSQTTNLRLVTTLDSLDYSGYGFLVTIRGVTKDLGLYRTGYRSLSASKVTYQPKIISSASQFFATVTINGFTATSISNNISIGVQPYWVTIDGTTVLGELDTKTLVPIE